MKIFISWSKNRSQKFAEALKDFLECVIQETKPFLSTGDIESGEQWFRKIMNNLSDTSQGIICLTPENRENPWIMFESGAIVKGLDESRIHVVLIGIENQDVRPPLSLFNMVNADEAGIRKLITSLNGALSNPLKINTLDKTFDSQWPEFQTKILAIENEKQPKAKSQRSTDEIMLEILSTVRSFDGRLRDIERQELNTPIHKPMPISTSIPRDDVRALHRFFLKNGINPRSKQAYQFLDKLSYSEDERAAYTKHAEKYWEISNDPGEQ